MTDGVSKEDFERLSKAMADLAIYVRDELQQLLLRQMPMGGCRVDQTIPDQEEGDLEGGHQAFFRS